MIRVCLQPRLLYDTSILPLYPLLDVQERDNSNHESVIDAARDQTQSSRTATELTITFKSTTP